eukprot:15367214-Ditylum_brightwellii.AAC.3
MPTHVHMSQYGYISTGTGAGANPEESDHNIAIYYPTSSGRGCKKLFQKGTDVKMYTVGPDCDHDEAWKSPMVDGKVAFLSEAFPCSCQPVKR